MNISIKSPNLNYDLQIENKLTIITGLSASGKTTLINLINEYNSENNIAEIYSKLPLYIINSNVWENPELYRGEAYYFIDEDMEFLKTPTFFKNILNSNGYFIVVGRDPEIFINYSIDSIYELKLDNGIHKMVSKYNIKELAYKYNYDSIKEILNEDSGSGFEFYKYIIPLDHISSRGNMGILNLLNKNDSKLVILDRSGYGKWINTLINSIESNNYNTILDLQNSFEYVILKSGVLGNNLKKFNLMESRLKLNNINLEKSYFEILIDLASKNKRTRYTKKHINPWYLEDTVINKIMDAIQEDTGVNLNNFKNSDDINNVNDIDNTNNMFNWD